LHQLAAALKGLPFWCSLVTGEFTHIGTTSLFRKLMTGETDFSRLQATLQRYSGTRQPGVSSSGVVIDSVLTGGAELGPGTVVIECHLSSLVRAASGAVLHGLDGIPGSIDVPEDTVIHQLPVAMPGARPGVVIRVYGVSDDPKTLVSSGQATWFGRPILEVLSDLGLDPASVWPGTPPADRSLWNACLFPLTTVPEAWECASWQLRLTTAYSAQRWSQLPRFSFASSAEWADASALETARLRRSNANWRMLAVSLVESGADLRPLLANSPGTGPLAEAGRTLRARSRELETLAPTEAASRAYAAGLFFGQAGLAEEAEESQAAAFHLVQTAVEMGSAPQEYHHATSWQHDEVLVEAPARIDLGGGWSDTPPFCLDWGGTVLNIAILLNDCYPIQTIIRRLPEPIIRCISDEDRASVEYRTSEELLRPSAPGDPFAIPRTALRLAGLLRSSERLDDALRRAGGGIEIRTSVNLPMGSGLGTSSILAATALRAIFEMMGTTSGTTPNDQLLSERVMRLEQLMTTGGGWQDQAGGIFASAKLLVSGPGLRQRIRVHPVVWTPERQAEFEDLTVLYYTGIRRVARDLLRQVVGRYLARETACVQVLHSIKTLAMEMAHAMQHGEWDYLGSLLDRHWELNQVLDPNTTNAPINALLESARPFIRGAKLAGAGGGGFLILLAKSSQAARELRTYLDENNAGTGGAVYPWRIAADGIRVRQL
jgi:fucokinase